MTPKTRTVLRRATRAALIAATIWLAAPSIGHAYWLNGVWIAPDLPPVRLLSGAATGLLRPVRPPPGLGGATLERLAVGARLLANLLTLDGSALHAGGPVS